VWYVVVCMNKLVKQAIFVVWCGMVYVNKLYVWCGVWCVVCGVWCVVCGVWCGVVWCGVKLYVWCMCIELVMS